jgi:flagellar motor switch protein FliN/FliY
VANDSDDPLDPAEIEALLDSAGGSAKSAGAAPAMPADTAAAGADAPPLSKGDLTTLLEQRPGAGGAGAGPEALLEQAAADLAAAVADDAGAAGRQPDLAAARPFELPAFDQGPAGNVAGSLSNLKDVELDLRIELGRTELLIEDVLKLREGSVVALDKLAGDPVDVLVNGRLVARGEVLVLNDNFCVRIAEILAPAQV